MSFNKNTLAVGPTTQRHKTRTTRVQLIKKEPGAERAYIKNGELIIESTAAQVEGQLCCQWVSGNGGAKIFVLYVAIDIDGTLEWKRVRIGQEVERYTRQNLPKMTSGV